MVLVNNLSLAFNDLLTNQPRATSNKPCVEYFLRVRLVLPCSHSTRSRYQTAAKQPRRRMDALRRPCRHTAQWRAIKKFVIQVYYYNNTLRICYGLLLFSNVQRMLLAAVFCCRYIHINRTSELTREEEDRSNNGN